MSRTIKKTAYLVEVQLEGYIAMVEELVVWTSSGPEAAMRIAESRMPNGWAATSVETVDPSYVGEEV